MQKLLFIALLIASFTAGRAQVTVSGATCVAQGVEYQYVITGTQDSSTPVRVCVQGGVIAGASDNCKADSGLTNVHVIWNSDTTTTGAITVTIGNDSTSIVINITAPLAGGVIDSNSSVQYVDSALVPAGIQCSPASGGNCSPSFSYQWQQKTDTSGWVNIDNATSQNLIVDSASNVNRYYRRQTTETVSGTIAYSGIAAIFINVSPSAFIRIKYYNEKLFIKNQIAAVSDRLFKTKHS